MRRNSMALVGLVGATLGATAGARVAAAQGFRLQPTVQAETRVFVATADEWSVGVGAGFNVPAGHYLRVAPLLAAGQRLGADSRSFARAEVTARFHLDPFRESRWGPWVGGGVAVDWDAGEAGRPLVVVAAGADLAGTRGWRPGAEVSLGGGVRLAFTLKPVRRAGR